MEENKEMLETIVFLAGGKSSRMGFDKEQIKIDGKYIIKENIEKVRDEFKQIIVVTNNPAFYSNMEIETTKDILFQKGPLSGIHAGLKKSKSKYIYLLACDTPDVDIEFIKEMKKKLNDKKAEILVGKRGQKVEPFNGFYSKTIINRIEVALSKKDYSIRGIMKESQVEYIDLDNINSDMDIFLNLNTKEDLKNFIEHRKGTNIDKE